MSGDDIRNGDTARLLELLAAQPRLKACPSVVLQVHGATNSLAGPAAESFAMSNCPMAVVYTLHDFTSEKALIFPRSEIARYINKDFQPEVSLKQRADRVVASNLGLLHAHVATTVSDNLAAELGGAFVSSSALESTDGAIFRTVQRMHMQGRWFGTPNGIKRGAMPDRAAALQHLALSSNFEPAGDTYSNEHDPEAQTSVRGTGLSSSLLAAGKRIAAGKRAAKAMLIERLDESRANDYEFARDSLAGMDDRLFVLFVGRFEKLKGVDTFMAAAKWACSTGSVLLLIGEHASYDEDGSAYVNKVFERYVRRGSTGPCDGRVVTIQERALQAPLLPLMRAAADIAMVPSTMEAFGFVSIEALAHSAAVVAANVGGLPDTVTPQLPPQRLLGIGDAFTVQRTPMEAPPPGALWTGELFARADRDEDASVAAFLGALRRATQRLRSMSEHERLMHLAVLQRVAHSYCWAYQGDSTVLGRWEKAAQIASKAAAAKLASAMAAPP